MVKNAVIVPGGAKGGFYVKRQFTDDEREAKREEGIACYKTFISGMSSWLQRAGPRRPPHLARGDDHSRLLQVQASSLEDIQPGRHA